MKTTNLRDVRVPINVADVVVGQAGKETDQMLQRCRQRVTEEILTAEH